MTSSASPRSSTELTSFSEAGLLMRKCLNTSSNSMRSHSSSTESCVQNAWSRQTMAPGCGSSSSNRATRKDDVLAIDLFLKAVSQLRRSERVVAQSPLSCAGTQSTPRSEEKALVSNVFGLCMFQTLSPRFTL